MTTSNEPTTLRKILDMIEASEFSTAEVFAELSVAFAPRPAKRGKLELQDYVSIITALNSGSRNKDLAELYNGVTPSRISEIKTGKSIPTAILRDYNLAKFS